MVKPEFGNATCKKQSNLEVLESSFTANVFVIPQSQSVMAVVVFDPMKNQALRFETVQGINKQIDINI